MPTRNRGALGAEAERLGVALDARARGRFARYRELIAEHRGRAGLTAIADAAGI